MVKKNEMLFVTGNQNKLKEIASVFPPEMKLISLADINFFREIPETEKTLEGNSKLKVLAVSNLYEGLAFAEDTGLEIEALNGEPGVLSARYAGDGKCNQNNIDLVLNNMKGIINRNAQFRTVLTFFDSLKFYQFEGICRGTIAESPRGEKGFGYDSIFIPDGESRTFGEMDLNEKNTFSHRKKAFEKFISFLKTTH